jgi:GHH signature containing HNH/Endo VII superfamily nuclease toxin  2
MKKERTTAFAAKASAATERSSCAKAVKCFLRPYKTKGKNSCCDGQTGHHIPPWSTTKSVAGMASKLKHTDALCVCLEGTNHSMGSHGKHHHGINYMLKKLSDGAGKLFSPKKNANGNNLYAGKLGDHVKVAGAVTQAQTNCSKECIEEQLKKQFNEDDLNKNATHNASTTGGESYGQLSAGDSSALDSAAKDLQIGSKSLF